MQQNNNWHKMFIFYTLNQCDEIFLKRNVQLIIYNIMNINIYSLPLNNPTACPNNMSAYRESLKTWIINENYTDNEKSIMAAVVSRPAQFVIHRVLSVIFG